MIQIISIFFIIIAMLNLIETIRNGDSINAQGWFCAILWCINSNLPFLKKVKWNKIFNYNFFMGTKKD